MKKIKFKKFIPLLLGFSAATIVVSVATPLLINKGAKHNVVSLVNKDGFKTSLMNNENVVYSNGLAFIVNNEKKTASVIGFQNSFNTTFNNGIEGLIPSSTINNRLVIPGIINNNGSAYIVDSIGVGAFFDQGLIEVSLPTTITTIGADAFANNKLEKVNLPSNLKVLGNNSFSNNHFKYGSKIFLPPECEWNKNGDLAPFNNTNNLGKFAPGVQFIIQNSAVYEFSTSSNVWRIESYMPSIAEGTVSNVNYDPKAMHYTPIDDPIKNPGHTHFTYKPMTVPMNSSLATSRIIFKLKNKRFVGSAKFENNQLVLTNVNNQDINLSIYSPSNNQTTFNSKTSTQSTINVQNGDILNFNPSDIYPNVATNVPENEVINGNNYNQFNIFYQVGNSVSWQNGLTSSFIVTENGLIPYQNITHIQNNILVSNATHDYSVKGITLANHIVEVQVGSGKVQTVQSNMDGIFQFSVPQNTPLNTMVKVNVEGCNESEFKLIGANPKKSALFLNINWNKFGISPDGYSQSFKIWNTSNTTMPDYTNSNPNVTSDNFNGKLELSGLSSFKYKTISFANEAIVNGKRVHSSVVIDLQNLKNYKQLQEELNSLKYYPNVTNSLTITIPQKSKLLTSVYSNDVQIPITNTLITNDDPNESFEQYKLTISPSGIEDPTNPIPNSKQGLVRKWIAGNYMLVSGSYGGAQMTNFSSNWYDPTPLMWQTVRDVTANLQTSYQKAVALSQWVSENMIYDMHFTYHKMISQTFNHLQGVCGNYAILLAVMCQMAGVVSRVIYGYALGAPNYFSRPGAIDHAWTQIWDEQLGEWITLDPTWNWYLPYGQIQSKFNISRSDEHVVILLWPRHTNYFSYFKGHEEQALNLLGMYFGVKQGQAETQYPAQYAVNLTQLINQASSYTDEGYGTINNH